MKGHANLYAFRDLDLMIKLADTADADGLATSTELADAMGLGDDGRAVSIRCAWMKRYGMLGFNEEKRGWHLTRGGERVVSARLKAAAARTIEAIPEEQLVDVMAHVTSRYHRGDPLTAHLLRREFLFGTQTR